MGFPIDNLIDNTTGAAGNNTGNTTGTTATTTATDRSRTESMSAAQWIAAAGGLGLAPIAPGTFGSLGGAVLFLGVLWVGAGNPAAFAGLYLALIVVLFGLGVWASGRAEREWAHHDDNRIVIDEVVGQLIALSPLVWFFGVRPVSFSISSLFLPVVTGFVLFRLFDVWKPGAVRWAERRFERGLGVMADDLVAGLYSAVVLSVGWGLGLALALSLVWGLGWESAPRWTQWSGALSDIGFRSLELGTEALA